MVILNEIVHIDDRRVFIDIAKSGCGNGCKYCYIETANAQQSLWSIEKIRTAIDRLENYQPFRDEPNRFVVSLCPSTEPFKSDDSYNAISYILKRLIPFGCFVQIATKEEVRESFTSSIDKQLLFEGQVTINTSIVTFLQAKLLEAKATNPFIRLNNIKTVALTKKIKSCVLIKPFIQSIYNELSIFKDSLSNIIPDYICVGIYFNVNCNQTNATDEVFFDNNYENADEQRILRFVNDLSLYLRRPIYPSTLCTLNQIIPGFITPVASKTNLCCDCGKCDKGGIDRK